MAQNLLAKNDPDEFTEAEHLSAYTDEWHVATDGFVFESGMWKPFWPPEPDTIPPPAGDVLLNATSISITGSTTGYCHFNTAAYRGRILASACLVTYTSGYNFPFSWTLRDRSGSAGSEGKSKLAEYTGRSIYHSLNNASSIAAFNNGSSNGFTLLRQAGGAGWSVAASNFRMRLTLS